MAPRRQHRRELGRVLERRRAAEGEGVRRSPVASPMAAPPGSRQNHRTARPTVGHTKHRLGLGEAPGEGHSAPGDETAAGRSAHKRTRGGAGHAELVAILARAPAKNAVSSARDRGGPPRRRRRRRGRAPRLHRELRDSRHLTPPAATRGTLAAAASASAPRNSSAAAAKIGGARAAGASRSDRMLRARRSRFCTCRRSWVPAWTSVTSFSSSKTSTARTARWASIPRRSRSGCAAWRARRRSSSRRTRCTPRR